MTVPNFNPQAGPGPGAGAPVAGRRPNRKGAFIFLAAFLVLMWLSEAIDQLIPVDLDRQGVYPREIDGLSGILAHPLLHANWAHLISNSIPIIILGSIIALSGLRVILTVTAVSWLVSGVAMWLIGANAYHIGASGVVFGFIFFVILRGIFTRKILHIVVGLVIGIYFGIDALLGLSPFQEGISWEGHLGGAIGGLLAARMGRQKKPKVPGGPGGRF